MSLIRMDLICTSSIPFDLKFYYVWYHFLFGMRTHRHPVGNGFLPTVSLLTCHYACAVSMSLTHSTSQSSQSVLDVSSTKSAWNCCSDSVFLCFSLRRSNAITLYMTNIYPQMWLLVVVVCMSNPGRFVVLVSGLLCLGIETEKFSPLRPFRPMPLNYTIHPFSRAFWHLFSHPTRCSWFRASLIFLCASVSPVISTSKIGFGGSTNSGLSRNRFRTSIPSRLSRTQPFR